VECGVLDALRPAPHPHTMCLAEALTGRPAHLARRATYFSI